MMSIFYKQHSSAIVPLGVGGVFGYFVITWLKIRPLGLVALLVLTYWLYQTKSNLRIVPPPEFRTTIKMATQKIQEIRREKPTLFCAISTVTLGLLAIFGHVVSGSAVVVLGLITAALISTKYNFKIVKIERGDFTWSSEQILNQPTARDEDDEFLPEETESNMIVLERASDLASLASSPADETEDKSDEIPSDLLIQDSIPEINEDDSTDDEIVKPMEFKTSHFKKDSSFSTSSSEDELSKGLQFPDHTTVDGKKQNQSAPKSSGNNLIPSLVIGVVQRIGKSAASMPAAIAQQQNPPKPKSFEISSDEESEFEILENDDFK